MLNRILQQLDAGSSAAAAAGVAEPEERIETPVSASANPAKLAVPSWLGQRVVGDVEILEQNERRILVRCEEQIDKGQYVWVQRPHDRVQCVVEECSARNEGDGYCLDLRYEPDRRHGARSGVSTEGELERLGSTRIQLPVAVTNVSDTGAQVRCEQPAPLDEPVMLRYQERTVEGVVRYCTRTGDAFVLGLEFRAR